MTRKAILSVMLATMTGIGTMQGAAPTLRSLIQSADTLSDTAKENDNTHGQRMRIGGYGEAVMTRNFFSQSFNRYNAPERYRNDQSHGRFDLPHVTFNLGYDFGKGWTLGTEIEFEHGGNETAVEIEAEESGEYEAETEKGGEVALEQL